jgi:hypothetical protein
MEENSFITLAPGQIWQIQYRAKKVEATKKYFLRIPFSNKLSIFLPLQIQQKSQNNFHSSHSRQFWETFASADEWAGLTSSKGVGGSSRIGETPRPKLKRAQNSETFLIFFKKGLDCPSNAVKM